MSASWAMAAFAAAIVGRFRRGRNALEMRIFVELLIERGMAAVADFTADIRAFRGWSLGTRRNKDTKQTR